MPCVVSRGSQEPGSSASVLTAMAHPVRRRLVDLLHIEDAATVSKLAELTGQAVGNVSHHLKVLARAGLVEEVPELAKDRREHWWRLTRQTISWSALDAGEDTAAAAVGAAAEAINLDRQLDLLRAWMRTREEYGEEWQRAAVATDAWMSLSAEELVELEKEVGEVLRRWSQRETPDDGAERERVFAFARGFPAKP